MAFTSIGSSFFYGTPSVLTVSGEITDISMSGVTCAEIETSNLSKTVKSFVLGTRDSGTITIVANMVAKELATETIIMPPAGSTTPHAFVLTLGNAAEKAVVLTGSMYFQSVAIETGIDAVISVTYVLQLTNTIAIA